MKATLKLEQIGHMPKDVEWIMGKPPAFSWVAEVVGLDDKYGLARHFLTGKLDYSQSNSKGTRGVYKWYILESGKTYEVKERTSWRSVDRYFVFVDDDGQIRRVEKEKVLEWLNEQSG